MKKIVYFDTSALATWYLNEPRSNDVERYIQEHGPVAISDLTVVEMRSLLARRRREQNMYATTERGSSQACRRTYAGGFLSATIYQVDWLVPL